MRKKVLIVLPALLLLHADFWSWDEPGPWLGLPAGLAWHVGLCLLAALLYGVLARTRPSARETPREIR